MDEQHTAAGTRECKGEHENRVETEGTHVVVAIERAMAMNKILVGYQQSAAVSIDIFDDILIAPVGELVDDNIAVACVEIPDERPLVLWDGSQIVIDINLKKKVAVGHFLTGKRLERRNQADRIPLGGQEDDFDIQPRYSEIISCRRCHFFFFDVVSFLFKRLSSGFTVVNRKSCEVRYLKL